MYDHYLLTQATPDPETPQTPLALHSLSGQSQRTDVGPYAEVAISTTAGVLLRDIHGHERITVSNHGFIHSSEVFHPSNSGTQFGEIEECWEALDIALVKLNPSISFTNQMYFEAKVPRRLSRSNEIPQGAFF